MATRPGKCRNYGNCDVADLGRIVEAAEENFVCPECGRKLAEATPTLQSHPRSKWLPLLAVVLVLAGMIGFLVWKHILQPTPAPLPSDTQQPNPVQEPTHPEVSKDKDVNQDKATGDEIKRRIVEEAGKK